MCYGLFAEPEIQTLSPFLPNPSPCSVLLRRETFLLVGRGKEGGEGRRMQAISALFGDFNFWTHEYINELLM